MLYITIIFFCLYFIAGIKIARAKETIHLFSFDLQETLPLRGLLAVCVFLTHLCPHLDEASPWLGDFGMWGPPSVATFFLLAGYGLAYSVKTKGQGYLKGFFRKRLMKLLWPFLMMAIIFQGYKMVVGTFTWSRLVLEPSPMSWFIYALLIWYVGFYVCFKNVHSYKNAIGRVWLFTVIYMAITIWLNMGYYWISILPLPMAITYVFYEDKVRDYICHHSYIVLSCLFLSFLMVMGYTLFAIYVHHLPGWGPVVYTTLPVWVLFLTYILGGVKNAVTNFLGRISYEFYIVHGFIVMLLADIIIVANPHVNSVAVILLLLGGTIICAWGLKGICKRINVCCS